MKINKVFLWFIGASFPLLLSSAQAGEQHEQACEYSEEVPILYYDSENGFSDYHFEITTGSCISECPPPTCEPCETPPCPKPPCPVNQEYRFVADTGYLHQPESADYLLGRFGVEYPAQAQFSALVMLGATPKIGGDKGKTALTVDVLGQYNWSEYFFGMGFGSWITSGDVAAEDSGLDLIANIGKRIHGKPNEFNMSVFLEARSALDELDEITEYGRFGIGLRFLF